MTGIVNMMLGARAWRASAGPGGSTVIDETTSGISCFVRFATDGAIQLVIQGIPTTIGAWVSPDAYIGIGTWDVQFSVVSGALNIGTGNTVLELGAVNRDAGLLIEAPDSAAVTFNAIVRLDGLQQAIAEYTIDLTATE